MRPLARIVGCIMIAVAFAGCTTCEPRDKSNTVSFEAESVVHEANDEQGARVIVEGIVRRVGSDPFSRVVVTDASDQDWYITTGEEPALSDYEQRRVRIRGTVNLRKMTLADGTELPEQRELSDVQVLKTL